MSRLVSGVGINDADYIISYCPYYSTWCGMLKRCYSKTSGNKSYYGVATVCEEWKLFSNFKAWMELQNWMGLQLDKDLRIKGNKVYSPETCLFVTNQVNQFLKTNTGRSTQIGMPTGVRWKEQNKRYVAGIRDFRTSKTTHIGYYHTPEEASIAYKNKKFELALSLAELQDNKEVAQCLVLYFKV